MMWMIGWFSRSWFHRKSPGNNCIHPHRYIGNKTGFSRLSGYIKRVNKCAPMNISTRFSFFTFTIFTYPDCWASQK